MVPRFLGGKVVCLQVRLGQIRLCFSQPFASNAIGTPVPPIP